MFSFDINDKVEVGSTFLQRCVGVCYMYMQARSSPSSLLDMWTHQIKTVGLFRSRASQTESGTSPGGRQQSSGTTAITTSMSLSTTR